MEDVKLKSTEDRPNTKVVHSGCRSCHLNCDCLVTVEDGRVEKIEGDPNGFGKVCARGIAAKQFVYSPTRLRYPLKRAGKRGEGKWERISWEQAVKEIAGKVYKMSQKYGPETFVMPGRTGRHDMGWVAHRIARTIGTPNNYYGPIQICYLSNFHSQIQFGSYLCQGAGAGGSALCVSFGSESAYAHPVVGGMQVAAKEQGVRTAGLDPVAGATYSGSSNEDESELTKTKMIALDPVAGPHAMNADEWLPIRPGTDLAYCMYVIRHLIKNNQYNSEFVKAWTNAPFLIREDSGNLLLESDVVKGGSEKRYMFWDENSNSLKYWDAQEVMWEGGASGKAHYDKLVELCDNGQASFDPSPSILPENVSPALKGSYKVRLSYGYEISCKPAFQQLAENVEEWTPEKTAEVTGVPADQIVRTADMIGTMHPVEIFQGYQYMSTNASQFFNACEVIKMITANIDNPGGHIMAQFYPVTPAYFPGEGDIGYSDGLSLEQKRKRLGYYEHRIGCGYIFDEWKKWQPLRPDNQDGLLIFPDVHCVLNAAETGRPYPVHGIIAISSNWLMHDPATARWMNLINDESKIELHVVTDVVMTPTAELADYVLPAVTWLERNYLGFGIGAGTPFKSFYNKAIDPIFEAKHDYEFGAMLAKELEKLDPKYNHGLLNPGTSMFWKGKYGKLWAYDTIDEERASWCEEFLERPYDECLAEGKVYPQKYDIAPDSYRYLISGKFPTDTGKCNLFSTLHQMAGYPPLPVYTEPAESPISRPDLAKDYPLVLTTGKRQAGFFHSEFRQLPWMREMTPVPEVFVNPKTAAEYNCKHGDWVWVESPGTDGRAPMNKVMGKLSTRFMTRPGLVSYAQHGWWRPEKSVQEDLHGAFEWNCESLLQTHDSTPETGTMGLRSQLCTIYKCSAEDIQKYHPEITREQLESFMPMSKEEVK
ncbi:MAG: molybdopterin-dependent oxidoreductase [Eubacteriales bacterium]